MNNSNKALRVSGISYGTGCEIPKEGTWVLNKGERVVGDSRDLKKYLLQNSNTGESKMQNDISKEAPLVLDENTVIKGTLRVKPIDGSVVGVTNNGELVIKELKAE